MGRPEFISLMAVMAALDAFSIDGIMPALSQIDTDLGITVENHRQYVITFLFLGFSIGVLIYGFLADQFGRKWPTLAGYSIFIVGTLSCIFADNFSLLLAGRLMQGLGAAGPYVLSIAIVRDLYKGREMARIMSLIMMIFIGVPIIAPFIGQTIMWISSWRGIFVVLALFALLSMLWFSIRQKETLSFDKRVPLSVSVISRSIGEILTNRQTLSYLLGLGAVSGAFIAYLSTGQQVFQEIYGLGAKFPIVFASLASTFGVSSWFNSRWVESIGAARLVHRALLGVIAVSILFLLLYLWWQDSPPLWGYIAYMAAVMFCFGLLFGNMTSLALEPMGHIAGSASSVVSSFSTLLSILLAMLIGSQLNTNVYPIVIGFALLAGVAWILNYRILKTKLAADSAV